MKKAEFKQPSALIFSLIAFFAIAAFGGYWTLYSNTAIINQQQSLLSGISRTQASVLERRLSAAFTSAQILAYEVEQNRGSVSQLCK